MTDAELDALVSDLNHTGELSMLYRMEIADAITALRAELAAERAKVERLRTAVNLSSAAMRAARMTIVSKQEHALLTGALVICAEAIASTEGATK